MLRKKIGKHLIFVFLLAAAGLSINTGNIFAGEKQSIKALYIPIADHYAGILAYEKYGEVMEHADYTIERMGSWPELRAYFIAGEADIAYIVSPMAMDMFSENPDFRWVGLAHRDGNALAINDLMNEYVRLPGGRIYRKPDKMVAEAFSAVKEDLGRPSQCAVPSLLATHTVVLYKYLRDHGKTLGLGFGPDDDVVAIEVPPPRSPAFLKKNNSRGTPASFEQSLPWADVVETGGYGYVAWYSKDVMEWPGGHVECIIIAADRTIRDKREALKEVLHYVRRAGADIEEARKTGGKAMADITRMIRRHIPEHTHDAIVQSLRIDLNVINYMNLDVDKDGLRQIMDLAVEGRILSAPVDIDAFADESFSADISVK